MHIIFILEHIKLLLSKIMNAECQIPQSLSLLIICLSLKFLYIVLLQPSLFCHMLML